MSDVTQIIDNGCTSPIVISPYKPIKVIRVVIAKGQKGIKGDRGTDGIIDIQTITTIISSVVGKDLKLLVGGGDSEDPASDSTVYQNDKLKGLGDRIQISIAEILYSSWGTNKTFDFDSVNGIIDFAYSGYTFLSGNSVYISLNQ